jgi:hypothetical protein
MRQMAGVKGSVTIAKRDAHIAIVVDRTGLAETPDRSSRH